MGEHEIGTLSDSVCLIQPVVGGRGAVSGRHCRDSPSFCMMWREALIGDFLDARVGFGRCGNFGII